MMKVKVNKMSATRITGPDGEYIIRWTDKYGTEIKEGSLITYAVRQSVGIEIYKACVTRVDERYIYVTVNDNSWWRKYRGLSNNRNARLRATHNIVVYGQLQKALVLNPDNSFAAIDALIAPEAVPEVL